MVSPRNLSFCARITCLLVHVVYKFRLFLLNNWIVQMYIVSRELSIWSASVVAIMCFERCRQTADIYQLSRSSTLAASFWTERTRFKRQRKPTAVMASEAHSATCESTESRDTERHPASDCELLSTSSQASDRVFDNNSEDDPLIVISGNEDNACHPNNRQTAAHDAETGTTLNSSLWQRY